jgi:ribonuclease HII
MPIESPSLAYEMPLWEAGAHYIAGLDEAGRGAWAGPVSAGCVILPAQPNVIAQLSGVRDSKLMTARQRAAWSKCIQSTVLAYSIAFASNREIDTMGIVPATHLAMKRALLALKIKPDHLLVDALTLPDIDTPQTALVKGDRRSLSIAAASVLAKTGRDALMVEMDSQYPAYQFSRHKGYGTRIHHAALQRSGTCSIHRFSFAPIRFLHNKE